VARDRHSSKDNDTNGFIFDVAQKTYTVIDNWLFDTFYCAKCLRSFNQQQDPCPVCKNNEILRLPGLSAHEKLVYAVLKRFAINPARIFPSHSTIAKATSLSVRTVIRAIKGLIKKDLIKVRSNKKLGKSNAYLLFDPFQSLNPIPKAGALKYLEDISDSEQPMPESHTPMTDRHTPPMTESHTKTTTYKSTTTTTGALWLCFSCKEDFKEPKIDKDMFSNETFICPACASNLIFDLTDIPLTHDNLLLILDANDPQKVHKALDVIHFQYKGSEIIHHKKLLISLLKKGIIQPDGFIPYAERKFLSYKNAIAEIERKKKEAAARAMKEKEDEIYFEEAKRRYDALSIKEKESLRKDAIKLLPSILKKHDVAIESAIFKYLMDGEFN
jgi:RNA polymerase subunit RPABC4/transcription elongation factor Spt4